MSLRDLVAADCAEPNPLARFMGGFQNDKVGTSQDQWIEHDSSAAGPSMSAFDRLRLKQMEQREREDGGDFFKDMEREARFDPLEEEAMEHSFRSAFQPEDGPLGHFLKSFVNAGHTKEILGRGLPDVGLSMQDKAKIRERAGIMSRHFYGDESQEFIDGQMHSLLDNLRIAPNDRFEDMEASWRQSTRRPPSMMEERRGGWADEFIQERGGSMWADEFRNETRERVGMRGPRMNEFDEYEQQMRHTQDTKAWIEEYSHHGPLQSGADAWAEEFRNEGNNWANEYATKSDFQMQEEAMDEAWKNISEDREFEEAWGEATGAHRQRSLTELTDAITRIDDPKLQRSNFMQFMHKINKGQVSFADNKVVEHAGASDWAAEYENMPERTFEGEGDWAREFENEFSKDFQDYGGDWSREYEDFRGTVDAARLAEYEFALNEASNPYADQSDAFEAGIDLFNQGMITESILALEAEVQRNPQNSRAWQYLGQAHAENDKDNQAITCLEKAVEVDPENLQALAALAVSYTNDFNRERALEALERWLTKNPEYTHIPSSVPRPPPSSEEFYIDAWSRHTHVANMYLEAARSRPDDPDPEVQTALGLLYNLSYEYDKAVDCFKAALTKRPEDYLLWNKLGATLANSNRSEEALGAYYRALEGKPTYVRARANLGISFLALNEYPDAAASFLAALRLHPNAVHLWDNLKMVFRLMGRDDLEERASNHNIDDFGSEFTDMALKM